MNKSISIVTDYLLQKGGAERVVQAIHNLYPESPIISFANNPKTTYQGFRTANLHSPFITNLTSRYAVTLFMTIPLIAPFVEIPESELSFFSSSGWSHYIEPKGRSLLYFHSPARWLYSKNQLRNDSQILRHLPESVFSIMKSLDKAKVSKHKLIVANSKPTQKRIAEIYQRKVEVVNPPVFISTHEKTAVLDIDSEFILNVSRTRSYKNHDFALRIASLVPQTKFVFVGRPPIGIEAPNVIFTENLEDSQLYWLYDNARMLLAVADEDFGLTPLEAANFGTPSLAVARGGYLETILNEDTGWLLDSNQPEDFARKIESHISFDSLDRQRIIKHSRRFSTEKFMNEIWDLSLDAHP